MINTIYLNSDWFSQGLTDDQINDYIWMLKDHGINQQFCDIGVLAVDGTLPAQGYAMLKQWIHMSRMVDPDQKIIAVLNHGKRTTNAKFGSSQFNKNVNNVVKQLVNTYQVDGIHLDIERFIDKDIKLLTLLQLLRNTLKDKHLSISTPATVWSDLFIKKVAKVVDQMNPMIYDCQGWGSEVVDETSYKAYFKDKVKRYAYLLETTNCALVPTLPSYDLKTADDNTVYHDPQIESMKVAIEALNEAISEGSKLGGAGIFWGSCYLGLCPDLYSQYDQDQDVWMNSWLNK